jgi:exosome complex RNA-binding protein Csl4
METCSECGHEMVDAGDTYECPNCDEWFYKPGIVIEGVDCPRCGGGLIPEESEDNVTIIRCDNNCGYIETV